MIAKAFVSGGDFPWPIAVMFTALVVLAGIKPLVVLAGIDRSFVERTNAMIFLKIGNRLININAITDVYLDAKVYPSGSCQPASGVLITLDRTRHQFTGDEAEAMRAFFGNALGDSTSGVEVINLMKAPKVSLDDCVRARLQQGSITGQPTATFSGGGGSGSRVTSISVGPEKTKREGPEFFL